MILRVRESEEREEEWGASGDESVWGGVTLWEGTNRRGGRGGRYGDKWGRNDRGNNFMVREEIENGG